MFKSGLRNSAIFLIIFVLPDFNPFENPPSGNVVQMFSPTMISDQFGNRDMAISPVADEMFWTLQQGNQVSLILHSKKINQQWSTPELAFFSGRWADLEPVFSPDGNHLYFASKRPVIAGTEKKDYDIWRLTKMGSGWSEPEHLPSPINSEANEFYPSLNRNGDIFYTREVENAKENILVSRKKGNGYEAGVSLPEAINSPGYEFNAYVDPDEKFIVFTGYGRKDDLGGGDLYISTKTGDLWQNAVHLNTVNSDALDYCPFVSPDGKYLFFTSNRSDSRQPFPEKKSLDNVKAALQNSGNGYDDIYWIELSAIYKR